MSPPCVLVVGSELRAGPRAIRSLRRAGYRVLGAHIRDPFGGRSLPCPRPLRHPPLDGDPGAFAEWLAATVARHGVDVVLGSSEDASRLLARNTQALGNAILVGPTCEQYAALCDKWNLAETAAAAGVNHPRTVVIGPDGPSGPVPLPAFVKPRESGEAIERNAPKAEVVRTQGELDAVVAVLAEHGAGAIAQEIVTGPKWSAHCVATRHGLIGVANKVVRDYPRGRGITSVGEGVPLPEGLRLAAERLAEAVGYRGCFSVNALEHDGRFVVHDVNLRLPASLGLSMGAGLDMVRIAVDDALGRPLDAHLGATFSRSAYISIDLEAAALRDALRGRGDGESATAIVRGAVRHLRGGGKAIVDPNPLDPFWLPLSGVRIARRGARQALRFRSRRAQPAAGGPPALREADPMR